MEATISAIGGESAAPKGRHGDGQSLPSSDDRHAPCHCRPPLAPTHNHFVKLASSAKTPALRYVRLLLESEERQRELKKDEFRCNQLHWSFNRPESSFSGDEFRAMCFDFKIPRHG